MNKAPAGSSRRWAPALPWIVTVAVVVVWLAPITLLGRMPIGGDVTSFFLPLMSYYRQSLLDGRVPLWNELWGFGFPMLAESQAGVFYPPHLVLYSIFEVEQAYAINIVLHSVLAAWFAYVCARAFGLRRWGATLAGLVFAGNGFFIVHFPHQWSYTTGCWMPLAVALAWYAVGGSEGSGLPAPATRPARVRLRAAVALALVLAVQMLAGHFQLAFYTQVLVLLIGLISTIQPVAGRIRSGARRWLPGSFRSSLRRPHSWGSRAALLWMTSSVAAAFFLAAVQILPTYELIRVALPQGRDFEYLSGFANTPLHLVSYLLPTLFHVNPLWRPVAWDPFHTSPEECFSYVGLLPLCLAVGGAWRWRREPRVRLWVLLGAITLLLSLGPYLPGFRLLIELPGFGGFRSASRWSLATALFLGLLAGRAYDGLHATARLRRWVNGLFAAMALAGVICLTYVLVLLAGKSDHAVLRVAQPVWRLLSPWPEELDPRRLVSGISDPASDLGTVARLANLGYRVYSQRSGPLVHAPFSEPIRRISLAGERSHILLQEFLPPISLALVLWAICRLLLRRRRVSRWLVLAWVGVELGAATWLRPTDFYPRTDLVEQSPVLRFLEEHAAGQRVLDAHQNLAMLAMAAPVRSYRTVDITIWHDGLLLDASITGPMIPPHWQRDVLARCGVEWLIENRDPTMSAALGWREPTEEDGAVLTDFVLGRIHYGRGLLDDFPGFLPRFALRKAPDRPSRAWFAPADPDGARFRRLLAQLESRPRWFLNRDSLASLARPVQAVRLLPEFQEYEWQASSPGAVVFSEPAYPGWHATLHRDGAELVSHQELVGTGCRLLGVDKAGDYRLQLEYRSRPYLRGRIVSLVSGGLAMLLLAACGRPRRWMGAEARR